MSTLPSRNLEAKFDFNDEIKQGYKSSAEVSYTVGYLFWKKRRRQTVMLTFNGQWVARYGEKVPEDVKAALTRIVNLFGPNEITRSLSK